MNNNDILKNSISVWDKLNTKEKEILLNNSSIVKYNKGKIIHDGKNACEGLIIVIKGDVKAYISNNNGRQITLYRLTDNDICVFLATCAIKSITFDLALECTTDTEVLLIPIKNFSTLLKESYIFNDFINEIIKDRFSDVMWALEQIVFHSLDERLANYLIENSIDNVINTTHEQIASELGSAREVISRMLKYFEKEKLVRLSRNKIEIIDEKKLFKMSKEKID